MAELKNIILDLGGVLLDINHERTLKAFRNLGFNDFEEMYNQYTANEVFEKLETGDLSEEEFTNSLLREKEDLSGGQIIDAWNTILEEFRLPTLKYLRSLSSHYKLFLLSNTNSIHFERINQIYQQQTGEALLDDLFTKAYYSYRIRLRKPGTEIFSYVLEDAGISAEETLFIDDSFNNIETARSMGFQIHLLAPGEKVEDLGLLNTDSC